MWQKLQGLIIRNRRQEREWSQAALCTGICEVSYLSRIERGKVEGSSEVLDLLFQRLGIQWRDDPDFCREASEWLEDCQDAKEAGGGAPGQPLLPGLVSPVLGSRRAEPG